MKFSRLVFILVVVGSAIGSAGSGYTQGLRGQEKKLLDLTKTSWVHFRDWNGRQLIYFTHLEVYRCGIRNVRYSLNSDALDKIYELQPCDPENPNTVTTDKPYISLPLGTARSISIQITFEDGTHSEIIRQTP